MELEQHQIDLLMNATEIRDDGDEPVVIRQSTLKDAKTVFGEYLEKHHDLSDPMSLPLQAQVRQIAVDACEDSTTVSDLLADAAQQPETGSARDDEIDAAASVAPQSDASESLSSEDVRQIETAWESAEKLRDRCPDYVAKREREICQLAGTDDVVDALEAAGLEAAARDALQYDAAAD